jgi:hypothetical protein
MVRYRKKTLLPSQITLPGVPFPFGRKLRRRPVAFYDAGAFVAGVLVDGISGAALVDGIAGAAGVSCF